MKNVLIIEDNDAHARLYKAVLKAAGYACTHEINAEEGLAAIAASRPDLVIIDLSLPGLSGIDAIVRLRGDGAARALPVIAITSYTDRYTQADARRAGADAYIDKSEIYSKLTGTVHALLSTPRGGGRDPEGGVNGLQAGSCTARHIA